MSSELITLLEKHMHFRYWQALHKVRITYRKAVFTIPLLQQRLSQLERRQSEDPANSWVQSERVRVWSDLAQSEDAAANAKIAILQDENEYARLREMPSAEWADLLPLPPLDPFPEKTEQQVAYAQRFEWVWGTGE